MSITIDGVFAGYTRDVPILTGIDLEVAGGEIVTILGPNGSGKSTLLKTMMGFLRPSAGEIRVDGASVAKTPVHRRATECGLGIVPQLENVFGALTVRQNLEIGGATLPRRERRQRVAELLELYPRLRERQSQRADLQSGGERQMLAVARALMTRPGHLLLDEPSAGLSPLMLEELFEMLRELRDRDGTTLLVVEQNAAQSLKSSDRGVVLAAGRVAIDAPATELLNDTRVSELYLGGSVYGN